MSQPPSALQKEAGADVFLSEKKRQENSYRLKWFLKCVIPAAKKLMEDPSTKREFLQGLETLNRMAAPLFEEAMNEEGDEAGETQHFQED